jgi:Cu2+-exporting ATPase
MAKITHTDQDTTPSIDQGCPSGQATTQDLVRIEKSGALPTDKSNQLDPYVQILRSGDASIDLMISGAHCAGCMAKIEREVGALEGINLARMNLSTMRLNVQWEKQGNTATSIVNRLEELGYGAKPFNMELAPNEHKKELSDILKALGVAGFAATNIMLLSVAVWAGFDMGENTRQLMHWASALIALPAVAYAGRPFFRSAWAALKNRQTNMDVPISLAVILACTLSLYETIHHNPETYFDAAVMLLFLLLIGRYLDTRLRLKTGEAAQRLAAMQANTASLILENGDIKSIPAASVKAGDILLIAPGEVVPVDVIIEKGLSEIDNSIVTGETRTLTCRPGDKIYSGTINLTAPLTVKSLAISSDSFLSEISKLVEAGEQKKGRFVRIADRAARAYVPVVHSLAILTFVGWLVAGGDLRTASLNAIAVLIITCPCALGLAVPAVQVVASGRLFKAGVLIKSGDALERLAKIDTIVFDKTGTLTLGRLKLTNVADIDPANLELAARLSRASRHPVSRAINEYAGIGPIADNIKEIAGQGVQARIDGKLVKFGSAKFVGLDDNDTTQTTSWLKIGRKKPIQFMFKDTPRIDSLETVNTLKQKGYALELLTGDTQNIAQETAETLGIRNWKAHVSPEEKFKRLQTLANENHYALMIGDGINDAPALANAYASASPAGAADISRAAADIILQGDRLSGLVTALTTAKTAQKRVIENLSLAVIYNFIAIPLAIFGFVNPLFAALAMSGSSILVTLNALRMASWGSAKPTQESDPS